MQPAPTDSGSGNAVRRDANLPFGRSRPISSSVASRPVQRSGRLFRFVRLHDPLYQRIWRDRFGYAVANRLSAVITYFDAGSTYVTPAIYA